MSDLAFGLLVFSAAALIGLLLNRVRSVSTPCSATLRSSPTAKPAGVAIGHSAKAQTTPMLRPSLRQKGLATAVPASLSR